MKRRSGFVSNSSSSSFVLSMDCDADVVNERLRHAKATICQTDNISDMIEEILITPKDVCMYFINYYNLPTKFISVDQVETAIKQQKPNVLSIFQTMIDCINKGKCVITCVVDNTDMNDIARHIYFWGVDDVTFDSGIDVLYEEL